MLTARIVPSALRAAPRRNTGTERWILLAFCCGIATIFSLYVTQILPAKYFFDAQEVQALAQGTYTLPSDAEYVATGAAYRFLHLQNSATLAALLTMIVFSVALLLAARRGQMRLGRGSSMLVAAIAPFLAAIYVSVYSKEAFVAGAVLVMVWLSRTRRGLWSMVLFALVYALFFRVYWALVAGFIPLTLTLMASRPSAARLVLSLILGTALVAIGYAIDQHTSLTSIRMTANLGRFGSLNAVTAIPLYVSGNSYVAGFANSIVTLPLLLFPVPLVLLASPQYLLAGAFLILVSWRLGSALIFLARRQHMGVITPDERSGLLCACASVSLAIVQGAYVPDYGSALKHFTPILPLVVAGLMAADTSRAAAAAQPALTPTPSSASPGDSEPVEPTRAAA